MSYIDTTVVVSSNFKLYTVDNRIASGCHEHSYGNMEPWKQMIGPWLPIKHGDFPVCYVCLPEGNENMMDYDYD